MSHWKSHLLFNSGQKTVLRPDPYKKVHPGVYTVLSKRKRDKNHKDTIAAPQWHRFGQDRTLFEEIPGTALFRFAHQ